MKKRQLLGGLILLIFASTLAIVAAPSDHPRGRYHIKATMIIEDRELSIELKTYLGDRDGIIIQRTNTTTIKRQEVRINYTIIILGLDMYARRPGNSFWAYVSLAIDNKTEIFRERIPTVSGELIGPDGSSEPMRVCYENGRIKLQKAIRVNTRIAFYVFLLVIVIWAIVALNPLIIALAIPVLAILLVNIPAEDALSVFWDPAIALIFGAFIIAYAMDKSGLAKRIAYIVVSRTKSPTRLIFSISLISFILAMWMSSLATMIVMLPIISTILKVFNADQRSRYAQGITLSIMLAAILGGMTTIVGNPANALAASITYRLRGIRIEFLEWMLYSVPVALLILLIIDLVICLRFNIERDLKEGLIRFDEKVIFTFRAHLMGMGPLTKQEKITLVVFLGTVMGWFTSSILALMGYVYYLHVAAVALAAGLVLMATGIFTIEDMRKMRWDILLVLGGSLSLVVLMDESGIMDVFLVELIGVGYFQILVMVIILLVILSIILGPLAGVAVALPLMILSFEPTKAIIIYASILSCSMVFGPQGIVLEEYARGRGFLTYKNYVRLGAIYTVISLATIIPLIFLFA